MSDEIESNRRMIMIKPDKWQQMLADLKAQRAEIERLRATIQKAVPAMWGAWAALDHNQHEHEAGNLGDAAKALEATAQYEAGKDE